MVPGTFCEIVTICGYKHYDKFEVDITVRRQRRKAAHPSESTEEIEINEILDLSEIEIAEIDESDLIEYIRENCEYGE